MFGFCGSRSLAPSFAPLVARVVSACAARGAPIAVGCARGADEFVRAAAPSAVVFAVGSGAFGRGRGAFAARSVALVRAVAAAGGTFVGFVSAPCPAGLAPSSSPSVCFRGLGSGSWASLAFAAGLGLPVFVFLCGTAAALPAWPGGSWTLVEAGALAGAWRWSPSARQGALFA